MDEFCFKNILFKEFLKFKKEIVHFDNDVIIHQPYEG